MRVVPQARLAQAQGHVRQQGVWQAARQAAALVGANGACLCIVRRLGPKGGAQCPKPFKDALWPIPNRTMRVVQSFLNCLQAA